MDLEDFLDTPPWDWPPNSGKLFLKTLTDSKAKESDRLIAAQLAGDLTVIDDNLAKALVGVAAASNQSEPLRAAAAISLGAVLDLCDTELAGGGEFDDPDDVPISQGIFENIKSTLKQIFLDETVPKEVRRRILEASVRAPEPWHNGAIAKAYASQDKEWVLTAVFAMQYIRGFDKEILELLNTGDLDIHCEAVEAAGTWEISAAWPHIKALLEDAKTPKRLLLAAIEALGGLRPPEAETILLKFSDSYDEDIREAAEEAMVFVKGLEDDDFEDDDDDATDWIN
jgi:hypothetical protein